MIPGANGLSSKETWFPRTNGPKFPSKHASLGNGPKVMGKPWFCGEMGSSFEETTWGKWIAFIHRMQFFFKFSFNMQLIIHTMQTFFFNFSSIFCNIFFNFSLSNVAYCRQKLQNGWIIVHSLHNFHWTTWSRGIQVLPPGGCCNSFVFLWQLAWGNYTKITSSISSVNNFFLKIVIIS
jgi:hypothetical protein